MKTLDIILTPCEEKLLFILEDVIPCFVHQGEYAGEWIIEYREEDEKIVNEIFKNILGKS